MRDLIKLICLAIGFFISSTGITQTKIFTAANAHSHNDYLNDQPFSRAYKNGFGSIEVDIFPVEEILFVAHHKDEIQPQRTFKILYLEPLLNELRSNNTRPVKLLIDIKENYELSLALLIREAEPLKQYLSTKYENKPVTILISGTRPAPSEYKNYPGYIFFDDDLKLQHDALEWERVGLVSLQFTKFSDWKGKSAIEVKDKALLKQVIDSVHKAGKTIRFWAAPDNEASWILQMKLGVDLIGTDKIDELAGFLRRRSKKK